MISNKVFSKIDIFPKMRHYVSSHMKQSQNTQFILAIK